MGSGLNFGFWDGSMGSWGKGYGGVALRREYNTLTTESDFWGQES